MKISFDAKRLFNNSTGLGNYSRTLVGNLHRYYPDNEYLLCTPKTGDLEAAKAFFKEPFECITPGRRIRPLWRSRGVVSELVKRGVQIYHGLSHEIPVGLKKHGIKSVVTIHDLIHRRYPKTYSAVDRAIYDAKLRHSLGNADAIVAISEQTKRDILEFFPATPEEKIHVIYQSCDPIYYQPVHPGEMVATRQRLQLPEEYLLYVGAFAPRKNLLNLIRAYKQLGTDAPALVMIGNGGRYFKRLQALSNRLGLEKTVVWLSGVRDTTTLRSVYADAKAFVYPSWFEGFGLPVVEALLSSVPVVTSNLSSLPEAAGPSSLLVDPHQVDLLATALAEVLEVNRRQVTESGYQYAIEHFSQEKTTQAIMELYRQLAP